jgi:hypothetical protein
MIPDEEYKSADSLMRAIDAARVLEEGEENNPLVTND